GARILENYFASLVATLPDPSKRLFVATAAFATAEFGRVAALALATSLGVTPSDTAGVDALVRRALLDTSVNETLLADENADRERLRLHPLLRSLAERLFAQWPPIDRDAASHALAKWYAEYANAINDPARVADEANITGALDWALARADNDLAARI